MNRIFKRKKTFESTGTQVFSINVPHDRITVHAYSTADDATFTVEEMDEDDVLYPLDGFGAWAGSGAGGSPDVTMEADSGGTNYAARRTFEGVLKKVQVKCTSLGTDTPDLTVIVSAEDSCCPQKLTGKSAVEAVGAECELLAK